MNVNKLYYYLRQYNLKLFDQNFTECDINLLKTISINLYNYILQGKKMKIREKVSKNLKNAMIKKDNNLISTLRLILAAIKDRDIISKGKGQDPEVNDKEIISLLQTMIKQRKGSIELYMQGNRVDLAKKEENEIKVISNFLPKQLSYHEIDEIIENTIKLSDVNSMKDIGKVIKIIKEQYDGMMDFGYVSKVIKAKLLKL